MGVVGRTATLVANASTSSITGTRPADRQAGDLCVATFAITNPGTITPPAGWTALFTPAGFGAANAVAIAAYYAFDPAADPTLSHTGAVKQMTAIVQAYGGVNPTTPIDVAAVTTNGTGTTLVATGLTVATQNALLLSGYVFDSTSRTGVAPSGMTLVKTSAGAGTGRGLAVAQEIRATGATGTRTWTTSAPTSLNQQGYVVALRPAIIEAMPSPVAPAGYLGPFGLGMPAWSGPGFDEGEQRGRASAYQAEVAADGPSVWWHLDESSGPFIDAIRGITATPSGAITTQAPGIPDATGYSARWDGSVVSYAEAASSSTFVPTQLTVEALFSTSSLSGNARIVQNGPDDSWRLSYESGALRFTVFGLAEAVYPWTPDGLPHHIVGTYNGTGTARLYLDGVFVGTEVGAGSGPPASTAGALRIGSKPTTVTAGDCWNGTLDEVAIYPTELSAGRIRAHAAAAGLAATIPTPRPAVFVAAAIAAAADPRARRGGALFVRTPTTTAGTTQTGDVAIASTFGTTIDATRGTSGDVTIGSVLGIAAAATRGATGDVTIGETFALTSSATRGTTGDVTVAETFGLTAAATRGAVADVSIGEAFAVTASATRGAVAAVTLAETFAITAAATRGATADITLSSTFAITAAATRSTAGDVTIAETFALTSAATRGTSGDVAIASTFALTVSAIVGPAGDVAIAETFGLTAAATRGVVPAATIASTFSVTAAAALNAAADVAVASTLQLVVDATVTSTTGPARGVVIATEAAVLAAVDSRRTYRPAATIVRAPQAGPPNVADVAIAETFGISAAAAVGLSAGVTLTETLGLTVSAVRGALGAVSVPLAFGMTVDATVGPVASVAIGETFAVTATATRGAVAQVAIAETFGIVAAATVAGLGAATVPLSFSTSVSAVVARTAGVTPVALSFSMTVSAIVTSGSILAANITGTTLRGAGITAAEQGGAGIAGSSPRGTSIDGVDGTGPRITGNAPTGARITGG